MEDPVTDAQKQFDTIVEERGRDASDHDAAEALVVAWLGMLETQRMMTSVDVGTGVACAAALVERVEFALSRAYANGATEAVNLSDVIRQAMTAIENRGEK